MIWNNHYRDVPEGSHAFLGASKYHWLNYDEEKLKTTYFNALAAQRGTRLHAYAKESILLGQKLPKSKKTLNQFVNDAIGYGMQPEQVLFYSKNCFGTADAISFKNYILRIHDLKTGVTQASMHQLEIYAGLFCLEYEVKPKDIKMEFRIYQNDDIEVGIPEPEIIESVMDKIVYFDQILTELEREEM